MTRIWLAGSLVVAIAACGGSTAPLVGQTDTGTGGGGGAAGGSGLAGTGGSAGMGAACAVTATVPGPHAVTFELQNASATPVYLWQGCEIVHEITPCATDYVGALATSGACSATCGPTPECVFCGACQSAPLLVAPAAAQALAWSGLTYTFDTVGGCSCHVEHVAPAGKYRISVAVWDTMPSDSGGMPSPDRNVVVDFELGTAAAAVGVPLQK